LFTFKGMGQVLGAQGLARMRRGQRG
jgi:hypothetical protein